MRIGEGQTMVEIVELCKLAMARDHTNKCMSPHTPHPKA